MTGDRHAFLLVDLTGSLKNLTLGLIFVVEILVGMKITTEKIQQDEVLEMICLLPLPVASPPKSKKSLRYLVSQRKKS